MSLNRVKPLIFGISGLVLTEDERQFFLENPVFGFILFKRNIESKTQLHHLIADLRNIYPERYVYLFVDQEGGRVARLKPPIISKEYPAAAFFSKIYDEQGSQIAHEIVKNNYYELTKDIKSYGFDSPCAPMADLIFSESDNVIGDRSFGSDSQKVIDLCEATILGITQAGGLAIIKHIPGHGRATCDSHFDLARVEASLTELESTDFLVFKKLARHKDIHFAMTAHIIFDAIDSENPVTISVKAIEYTRKQIGFKGLIMTDDLSMLALHGKVGKDYSLVKKIISANEQNNLSEIKNELKEDLEINDCIWELSQDKISKYLGELFKNLQSKYLESLKKVTMQSIEAGCDLVLHCSGDLDEMKIIASNVDIVNLKAVTLEN